MQREAPSSGHQPTPETTEIPTQTTRQTDALATILCLWLADATDAAVESSSTSATDIQLLYRVRSVAFALEGSRSFYKLLLSLLLDIIWSPDPTRGIRQNARTERVTGGGVGSTSAVFIMRDRWDEANQRWISSSSSGSSGSKNTVSLVVVWRSTSCFARLRTTNTAGLVQNFVVALLSPAAHTCTSSC